MRVLLAFCLAVMMASSPMNGYADSQGTAKAMQGAQMVLSMGGMMFASMKAPPCFQGNAGACTLMGLGIAAAVGAQMLAGSNGDTAGQLSGDFGGNLGSPNFNDPNFTPNDVIGDPTACANPDSNPIQCKPGEYTKTKNKMISDLKNKLADGSLTGQDAKNVGDILGAIDSGDVSKLNSLMAENKDALQDMNQFMPAIPDSAGAAGQTGAEIAADGGGSTNTLAANGKRSAIDGALVDVDWNGMIDMLDSKTGKSLTIWQRATRRYQGGPNGKRALTMARMELIRKTAFANLRSQNRTPTGAPMARQEAPSLLPPLHKPPAMQPRQ